MKTKQFEDICIKRAENGVIVNQILIERNLVSPPAVFTCFDDLVNYLFGIIEDHSEKEE